MARPRPTRFALAGAVVLTVAATGCGSDTTATGADSSSPSSTTASTAGSTTPPTTAASTTSSIALPPGTALLQDYEIVPTAIDVAVGGTVTWQNLDEVDHALLAEDGTTIATGHIPPATSATTTFTAPGTYAYYCDIHNGMRGTVVVS